MVSANPDKVRAGRIGGRRRWGDPGVVKLEELTPPQRRLVIALVAAAKDELARDAAAKAERVRDQHSKAAV